MADRGKTIKNLQAVGNNAALNGDIQSMRTIDDVLALLKEQPIRCAECEYYEKRCPSEDIGWCNRPGAGCGQPEDFWCAGAVKAKEEVKGFPPYLDYPIKPKEEECGHDLFMTLYKKGKSVKEQAVKTEYRRQVIEALAERVKAAEPGSWCTIDRSLLKHALELLQRDEADGKAPGPKWRVNGMEVKILTLTEVEDELDSVIWLDEPGIKNTDDSFCLVTMYSRIHSEMGLRRIFSDETEQFPYAEYGRTWRCWNRRPWDDMRAGEPWKE